ncbi:uncharacterized protein [Triticum aestivum]|uniref:uncharacterized protein n=1 Tax=Triticum aestivum TaxID=4565 RepID=UPI001D02F3B3|nr:uncharacterized protein LOC123039307 [Triticum aestivum]
MDPFHDGHHVRLRRSTHAAPHPGEGGEVATLGPRRALLEAADHVGGLHPGAADGGYLAATSSNALPAEHHLRLRSRTHTASSHPGEGGEVANLGLRPAPPETPSGRFLAATGAPVPRAKKHRGFDDDEPGAFPLPSQEYGLRRRRAGEEAKAGFRCGGYEWVLDSRHAQAPAAAGEVPPHHTELSGENEDPLLPCLRHAICFIVQLCLLMLTEELIPLLIHKLVGVGTVSYKN